MGITTKRAWKAYQSGEIEKAGQMFAELSQAGKSQNFTQQGMYFLKLDQFKEACQSFEKAMELAPSNPAPVFFLALAQELAGDKSNSRQSLEHLKAVSPHHQGYSSLKLLMELREGSPGQLLQSFGFGPAPPQKESPKFTQRIAAGLGRGDPAWLPSDLSSSSYLLGPILIEVESKLHPLEVPKLENHVGVSPEELEKLEARNRPWREQLNNWRSSFIAGNLLKKGKSLLEKAFGISQREEQHALLKKAVVLLRAARKRDPFAFRVSYHLAECYIFLSKNEPGEPYSRFKLLQANSSCLQSAEKEGINPYLLFYLAYIQHLLGRPRVAISYYQAATKKFEKLPEAHYGEGQCHLLLGDRKKAKELLLKAVNSDLALARERMDLFAKLLAEKGPSVFDIPFPEMPEMPPTVVNQDENLETELSNQVAGGDQVPHE